MTTKEIGTMTVMELLELLDGNGLVITDEGSIAEELSKMGYASFDTIKIYKGGN
jgi:hypothetical protein